MIVFDTQPDLSASNAAPQTLDRLLATLGPMQLVIKHTHHAGEHVVMFAHEGRYSVCRLHPTRRIATAPNYHVASEQGLLRAALSKDGLMDLLHWTDRETALSRFKRLTNPGRPAGLPTAVIGIVSNNGDPP